MPLEIGNGATVIADNVAALNANVLIHTGGTLIIKAAGLNGTGIISRDSGPITLGLDDPKALLGPEISGSFLVPGDSVRLQASNVVGLKQLNPALNYVIDAPSTTQQGEGFNINGGTLFFRNPGQSLQTGPAAVGDSTIRIGTQGATIAGFGGFLFSPPVAGTSAEVVNFWDSSIQVPVVAQGTVNFGYAANVPSNSSGAIVLTNSSNQFGTVNINNVALVGTSPGALTGANITLNGGALALFSNGTGSSPTLFNNPVVVNGPSAIVDDTRFVTVSSTFLSPNHAVALNSVTVGSALLFLGSNHGITINSLQLNGNATLYSSGSASITLNGISEDSTSRSLNFTGNEQFLIKGPLTSTGPIDVAGPKVEFDSTVSAATAPVTVDGLSTLSGNGTIHRPVVFSTTSSFTNGGSLVPGVFVLGSSAAGALTMDSLQLSNTTTGFWNLGTPNVIGGSTNDLVAVLGDLTLAGSLDVVRGAGFGPGTYTLFTYGGTLTNNGVSLGLVSGGDSVSLDLSTPGQVNLIVTAMPEPGTLGLGLACTLLLGHRNRRRRS